MSAGLYPRRTSVLLAVETDPLRDRTGGGTMWDTVDARSDQHLSHDLPCPRCGHALHTYLPCSDTCDCVGSAVPGSASEVDLAA
jgi:hypothetical protein